MEFLWLLIGAAGAWAIISFRANKKRMRNIAEMEFAQFRLALEAWDQDPESFEKQQRASHHYIVFSVRYSDFLGDPSGRTLPAERAVLSSYFVQHMASQQLVKSSGEPSYQGGNAAVFWGSLNKLRELYSGPYDDPEPNQMPAPESDQKNPQIAAMTRHLQPYAGNLEALWANMEDAFMLAYGRPVDKDDAHDVMLCHAALAPFNMEQS